MADATDITVDIDHESRTTPMVIIVHARRRWLWRIRACVFGAVVWIAAKVARVNVVRIEWETGESGTRV